MLTEKENSILEKAEDAILKRITDLLERETPMSDSEFETIMDGVRTVDRICRLKSTVSPTLTGP